MAELQIKNFHWQSVHLNEPKEKSRLGRSVLAAMPVALASLSCGYCWGYSSSALEELQNPAINPIDTQNGLLNLFRNSLLARYVAII